MLFILFTWLICTLWFRLFILLACRPLPFLKDAVLKLPSASGHPKLSVLVPAKNEAQDIHENLLSLMNSTYPNLEVIAINDRSSDQTGEIMDGLAKAHSRLKVCHIQDLPQGWLGKNNAIYQGSQVATGDYLLFTDGDIFFAQETLKNVMSYVQHHGLDYFSLFPEFIRGGYWENAFITHFGILFLAQLESWKIGRDSKTYFGVGAFNLVRRSLYEKAGGHQALRLEVLDDVMLGKLMMRNQAKSGALMGGDQLRVRWHQGISGLIKGLEKNGFAALRFSLLRFAFLNLFSVAVFVPPYLGLYYGFSPQGKGLLLALLIMHSLYAIIGYRSRQGWAGTLGIPVVFFIGLYIFWHSTWLTLKQKGIYWRDTFYSMDELKENMYL